MSTPDRSDHQHQPGPLVPVPGPGQPGQRPGTELEPAPQVLDAELVDDEDTRRAGGEDYARRRSLPVVRPTGPILRVVATAATSPRATAAAKATARTGMSIGAGFASWAYRAYDGATHGVYKRTIRATEAAGDRDALALWTQRLETARDLRHQRRKDLPKLAVIWGLVGGIAVVGLVVVLTLAGLVAQVSAAGSFTGVWHSVFSAIRWLVAVAPVVFTVVLVVGAVVLVGAAWREGRARVELPPWLSEPTTGDGDVMDGLPDEGTIINALRNLNIPGFNRALKQGWRIRFRQPPTLDGKGWRIQLDLPPACPVEEIVKRKTMLAHNLLRFPIEVWPTEPQPSVLDLWVAKSGALSGPVDPWPLLADLDNASTDYFTGVPAGVTIKGDVVRGRLSECNYVVGGMMGSGKSTLVITLVLGAMLDPLVDIDVVVMAENADYDPMKPRLRTLVTGAGEDTVDICLAMLYGLYEDLSVRGQALREHDERAATRELSQLDERLRPRIMVIDECQNLFLGEHGKEAIEVTSKLMSTARKYAITLMFLTPEPSKDALPRKLITIASNKACFAIGDQHGNDAVLGTGSYKSGISAVGLTPKTDEGPGDVGTCMARGFTARPGLLRSFYAPQRDAHRVTQRAMQLRAEHGIRATVAIVPQQERDLLEDVEEVLDTDPVPIAELPPLLRNLAPQWPAYKGLTGVELRTQLADLGVKVPATGNRWPVDPVAVREALARRSTTDLDDDRE